MYGMTRGLATLIGAALAGGLIWFAAWIGMDSNAEYWAFVGLLAAAGLVMALSQLLGGWTKWGLPTISPTVFGLAFVPTLIAAGWVLVAAQPNANGPRDATRDWLAEIGLFENVLEILIGVAPVIAFGLGLVFGLVFDTTGPRRREEIAEERHVAEEPVAAEREHVTRREPARPVDEREPTAVGVAPSREARTTPEAPQPEPGERPRRRLFRR
jgi:hypothetical protein